MTALNRYQKELAGFEAIHLYSLREYLREMLEMLPNPNMDIDLNSDKVDGNSIHIGNYTDHINKVNGRGETIVYNNVDCDPAFSTIVYDDKVTIFSFDLATTAEVVKCVEAYFEKINSKYVQFQSKLYMILDSEKVEVRDISVEMVELLDVQSEIDNNGTISYSVYMSKDAVNMLPKASQDDIAVAERFYATLS